MDSQPQDQQHRDFMPIFPQQPSQNQPGNDSSQPSVFPYTPQQPFNATALSPNSNNLLLDMDLVNSFLSMQGLESPHPQSPMITSPIQNSMLLEQQFKLSQLQQLQALQTQILQQQMRLLSSNTQPPPLMPDSMPDTPMDRNVRGLQTPGSSEMRPHQPMNFVSPTTLHYLDNHNQEGRRSHAFHGLGESPYGESSMHPSQPQYLSDRGCTSAPAHIAFQPPTLPLGSDIDFDISPLTSPWLGPDMPHPSSGRRHSSNKRPVSPSAEGNSRKKQSPAIGPTDPGVFALTKTKSSRDSKSTSSTPLLRSSSKRNAFPQLPKNSTFMGGEPVGDSPSPVDLSMPPPAQPANVVSSSASSSSNASDFPPSSPAINPHLMPVTPASIMNLGRLGLDGAGSSQFRDNSTASKPDGSATKGRSRASSRAAAAGAETPTAKAKTTKKAASTAKNNATSAASAPVEYVRKTSHKAAEQKRRDSLKTTFDDLRGLLPPIPLPSDDTVGDPYEHIPGARPPRGPPKAGGEGPNKSVSKLQLLMCGNDFIRQLKSRIARRDEEIEKLRREVSRLRLVVGEDSSAADGGEELDLSKDLDAIESGTSIWPCGKTSIAEEDDEGDVE